MEEYVKEIKPQMDEFIEEHGMSQTHVFLMEKMNVSRASVEPLVKYLHRQAEQRIKERIL
jgi:hypothetical protein